MATLRSGVEWEWGGRRFGLCREIEVQAGGAVLGGDLLWAAILIVSR